ncbi:hypothetical protein L6452_03128 [Arctium lappa]|uniref:Uncharacterized protein n=1 Tax=Arctium lappa TaxID=4217 RepID=A0ACB9FML1_ARCLA|nr:hypothetical protein L6452_03128 [Arctium lappa]
MTPEDLRPDEVPKGYCVLYEYPFKIGFTWPFSPLVRAFLDAFDMTLGQLMPQFWRIVQVVERLTADWKVPFNLNDLLTAYSVGPDNYHRYSLFPRSKGDNILVHNTAVNDRGWKRQYVFLQVASVSDEDNQCEANKIQRILERSIADRSFSVRSNDEEDEVVFVAEEMSVEGSRQEEERRREEEKEEEREEERKEEMTGDASTKSSALRRVEQLELARQGREKTKKKSAPSAGADTRRVTKDTPTSGVSGANKPFLAPSSSSKGEERNKEKVGETTFKVTLPSDFMANDVLERDVIFPHLGKFLLPTFYDRYKESRVEDTGAHAAGLSFMTFQACLSFFAQMEGLSTSIPDVKKRADEALEREKVALEMVEAEKAKVEGLKSELSDARSLLEISDREKVKLRDHLLELEASSTKLEVEKIKAVTAAATSANEVASLKKRVDELEGDVKDLETENRQIEGFSRFTARAALMRRHLTGKNPMASAAEELKTYLDTVGTERDLDKDDELEGSDGGEEAAAAETDVVQEQSDVPPS